MRIGYLIGADAHGDVERGGADIASRGSTDLYRLRTRDPGGYARLHVTRNYFRQPTRYDLSRYDVLLNLVTDADQNPKVLAVLARMVKGFAGRVINRPEAVLRTTRDKVARACAGVPGVVAPRTVRLKPGTERSVRRALEGVSFPAILRVAGTHSGRILGRVDGIESLLPLIEPGRDHVVTEFVDFRSPDGLYRKCRFFFIGGETVMRHLLVSDRWNVHAADRTRFMSGRPDLIREEREAIEYGLGALPQGVRRALAGVREAVGLDCFGLDCALLPGGDGLLLFEANATMNFFPIAADPKFAYLERARARAQEAFDGMLYEDRAAGLRLSGRGP